MTPRDGATSSILAGVTPDDSASLELPPAEMLELGQNVLRRVVEHIAALGSSPCHGDLDVSAVCRSIRAPAPEQGAPLDTLLDPLFSDWVQRSFNSAGPGYLAFIPGGGLFPSALADLIADGVNRYTGVWQGAPALVELEANVLRWFSDWMQFPSTARGLLTSGGTLATFSALVSAREQRLGTRLREGVLYTSSQAHHSVLKTARLAGILPDCVRSLEVDDDFRLRPDALDAAIAADRARGLVPFIVVSSAGTTNTGAVDPLDAVADIAAREGLWHHVDGAYGAFFHMCPELRPLLAGLPRADSLTLDPHKGLFLPYGTGALLVRDGEALRAAHAASAGYLPDAPDPGEFYDPSAYGPELSRDFRGLRVWLPLSLFGTARFRAALLEKRALALDAAARVAELPGVALVAPPQLSLFAFHLHWPGSTREQENDATGDLMRRVTARGRVMLTGARVGERFLGRVCVLAFRTRKQHVDACVEDIAAESAAIFAERTDGR